MTPISSEAERLADELQACAARSVLSVVNVPAFLLKDVRLQLRRIPELEAEVQEQARLNGMGAERELALRAQVSRLEAERDQLRAELEKVRSANIVGYLASLPSEPELGFWFEEIDQDCDDNGIKYEPLIVMPTPPHADQKGQ